MIKLEDLKCFDNMFYIGEFVDMDGDGWVDEETAIHILSEYENGLV